MNSGDGVIIIEHFPTSAQNCLPSKLDCNNAMQMRQAIRTLATNSSWNSSKVRNYLLCPIQLSDLEMDNAVQTLHESIPLGWNFQEARISDQNKGLACHKVIFYSWRNLKISLILTVSLIRADSHLFWTAVATE